MARKICLSISGHHPESWLPSWSIRTALLAIIGFMPSPGMGAIASLDYTKEERQRLAKKSLEFECPECGGCRTAGLLLEPSPTSTESNEAVQAEAREIASQVTMKGENNKSEEGAEQVLEPPVSAESLPAVEQPQQRVQVSNNPDPVYSYIIAAILVMVAILVYRRFAHLLF